MTPAGDATGRWSIDIDGGPRFAIAQSEDSLLRGALRAGLGWPHECNVGGCGSCRFELLDGEVEDVWPEAPGLSARERQRGKRLACQTRARGNLRVRVRLDDAAKAVVVPRRFAATLVSVRALTGDLSEFCFSADGEARFLPGQYALFELPGVCGVRAYSMSNLANGDSRHAGLWRFVVRRIPGGKGSVVLFDGIGPGSAIAIDGPYGHAYLRPPSPRNIVCIAGGSGLGAMLSIVRGALQADRSETVHLFVGMRSQSDLACLAEVEGLDSTRLTVTTVLSNPDPDLPWDGATGFVHDEVERRIESPLDRFDFYFAGPPAMAEAMQRLLMVRHKMPFEQIHFDRFL